MFGSHCHLCLALTIHCPPGPVPGVVPLSDFGRGCSSDILRDAQAGTARCQFAMTSAWNSSGSCAERGGVGWRRCCGRSHGWPGTTGQSQRLQSVHHAFSLNVDWWQLSARLFRRWPRIVERPDLSTFAFPEEPSATRISHAGACRPACGRDPRRQRAPG